MDDDNAAAAARCSISYAIAKNHDYSIACIIICGAYESPGRTACAIAVRRAPDNAPAWRAAIRRLAQKPKG